MVTRRPDPTRDPTRRVWTGFAIVLVLAVAIAAIGGFHPLFFWACAVALLMFAGAVLTGRIERKLARLEPAVRSD
jgi:hypothetical protein